MMEEKMRKRLVTIGMILGSFALCTVTFFGIRARFVPHTPKNQTVTNTKSKAVSVYVDDGTGTYRPNEDGTFPTKGYVLNTEKSGCANGGVLSQNPETKTISLSVSSSDQCHVYFDKEALPLLTTILDKANASSITDYNSANKGEMFVFNHTATGQVSTWTADELRDYRYIGTSPNNYIQFNDETWRIIGVFTVETEGPKEQLVKIIREESIGTLPWNSSGENEWVEGSLQTLLNGDYLNREGSYEGVGLNALARSLIATVKFYLGSADSHFGGYNSYVSERQFYEFIGDPDPTPPDPDLTPDASSVDVTITRSSNTIQKVGLMYPSDYLYTYANGVNSTCYEDGLSTRCTDSSLSWLSYYDGWTQSPSARESTSAYYVYPRPEGFIGYVDVNGDLDVHPVVYLNSGLQISGSGTQNDMYKIVSS